MGNSASAGPGVGASVVAQFVPHASAAVCVDPYSDEDGVELLDPQLGLYRVGPAERPKSLFLVAPQESLGGVLPTSDVLALAGVSVAIDPVLLPVTQVVSCADDHYACMLDLPDLPNWTRFDDAFRAKPASFWNAPFRLAAAFSLCVGVAHLHKCRLVFRDLRLGTVLLNTRTAAVRFVDFGAARFGVPVGPGRRTLLYHTQLRGAKAAGMVSTSKDDLFPLGVLVAQTLTDIEFQESEVDRVAVALKEVQHELTRLGDSWAKVVGGISSMLSSNADERMHAADLRDLLLPFVEEQAAMDVSVCKEVLLWANSIQETLSRVEDTLTRLPEADLAALKRLLPFCQ